MFRVSTFYRVAVFGVLLLPLNTRACNSCWCPHGSPVAFTEQQNQLPASGNNNSSQNNGPSAQTHFLVSLCVPVALKLIEIFYVECIKAQPLPLTLEEQEERVNDARDRRKYESDQRARQVMLNAQVDLERCEKHQENSSDCDSTRKIYALRKKLYEENLLRRLDSEASAKNF